MIRKKCKGQAVILFMLIIPIMILMLCVCVNVSHLVRSKVRLQNATDRAVYAGAATLTHYMNKVAEENWRLNHAFKGLKKTFATFTSESSKTSEDEWNKYRAIRAEVEDNIKYYINEAYPDACSKAESIIKANLTDAKFYTEPGFCEQELLTLFADFEAGQEEEIKYSYTFGGEGFIAPAGVESPGDLALRYFMRQEGTAPIVFAGWTEQDIKPFLSSNGFKDNQRVLAAAAAQPYGGSIKEFALKESDSLEELKSADEGEKNMYKTTYIPINEHLSGISGGEDVFYH